ncbi:hypothetical protein D9613_008028 [Agrocybe pediades]|uniref:Uncharacterized protein n=1 Tax=Agrocybe pediades TaxID=84607 RepID=A0A8H4VLU1_9AGAR|nr:hypothetical protein D9613_008028 [Agrocybe pediades]
MSSTSVPVAPLDPSAFASVSEQKSHISSKLNVVAGQQFLSGIYTGLFGITIYVYLHSQRSRTYRDWIITGVVATLYILTALAVSLDWQYANQVFSIHSPARLQVYTESLNGTLAMLYSEDLQIMFNIAQFGGFIVADGLLVWRCFHACGRSFRKSCFPILSFIAETGFAISAAVFMVMWTQELQFNWRWSKLDLYFKHGVTSNRLVATALVLAAVTSLMATFIICYQIYRCTPRGSGILRSRYRWLLTMLIQSSGAYSVAVSVQAVLQFLDHGVTIRHNVLDGHESTSTIFTFYSNVLLNVIVVSAAMDFNLVVRLGVY